MFVNYVKSTLLMFCLLISAGNLACINSGKNDRKQPSKSENQPIQAVDINRAESAELEKLPFIGAEIAKRIIEYREKHGRFRRTEELILVEGMSDKKFRELQNLVKVE